MAASEDTYKKFGELRKRIGFTLLMILIYRIGVHVPTPGVDANAVMGFFDQHKTGLFSVMNMFSGGALKQFSILALGIMPYISSSIIMQLLTTVIPQLEQLQKEGDQGRKKINQFTRYLTVILAVIQGLTISSVLMSQRGANQEPLVTGSMIGFVPFQLMTVITLTAGTCFVMWLGEQITERGIGNGSSMIIFSGISADIPSATSSLLRLVSENQIAPLMVVVLLFFMVAVICGIVFLETGLRKIPIQSLQKMVGRLAADTPGNSLPLKINFSNVIPPIFASSLLLFPATLAQFWNNKYITAVRDFMSPSGSLYNLLFVGLIIFFCFFYVEIVFKPDEVAENLKKYGRFIPGVRAGKPTAEYLQKVLERITVGGAIYLSVICVLPSILISAAKVPFYFGGTSLMILIGVALDTTQQIQSHLISQKYEGIVKGVKLRGRRVTY